MRTLSSTFLRDMFLETLGTPLLTIATIENSALPSPIRIVNNNEDIISNGNTFSWHPFELTVPDEENSAAPTAEFRLANAGGEFIDQFRSAQGNISVTMAFILGDTPDVYEFGPWTMVLREFTHDDAFISGTLSIEDILNEPYPAFRFVPSTFPGLFQ